MHVDHVLVRNAHRTKCVADALVPPSGTKRVAGKLKQQGGVKVREPLSKIKCLKFFDGHSAEARY
jgi:hypothetical protein